VWKKSKERASRFNSCPQADTIFLIFEKSSISSGIENILITRRINLLSIICVLNNKDILDKYLLNSLEKQTEVYDLVLVDNSNKQFASASEALNYGGALAKGDYLIFIHQDVIFKSETFLKDLEKKILELPKDSIIGCAGVKGRDGVMTTISHGNPPRFAGNIKIKKAEKCQTLDEVLIGVSKKVFSRMKFDSTICDGWHLYAVDYCLSAAEIGIPIYVLPLDIFHLSSGSSMDSYYYEILRKVASKHQKKVKTIYTTMGTWPTSKIKLEILLFVIILKKMIYKYFLKIFKS